MNRILRIAGVGGLWLVVGACPAFADTFHLSNGNTIEGLVLNETPEQLEIQFAAGGSITFHKEEIASIEKAGEDSQAQLKERWAAQQEEFKKELKAQEEYRAAHPVKEAPAPEPAVVEKIVERIVVVVKDESKAAATMDLSKPIGPGYVISYPFWNWKGEPEYRTFPVVYNRVPHRQREHERQAQQPSPFMQARAAIYNKIGTTSVGALAH